MEPTSDVGVKEEKIGAERSVAGTYRFSAELSAFSKKMQQRALFLRWLNDRELWDGRFA